MKKIFLAALLSVASSASAQSADAGSIAQGTRVKIRTATIHAAVGSVASSTPDSVVIVDEKGARLGVARGEITQLYVSNGRTVREGAKRGVLWGLGFGVLGGAMFLGDPCSNSPNKEACKNAHKGESRTGLAAANFAAMTLGGVIAGATIKAEEWHEASTQSRFAVKPVGSGLALSINFR